MAIDGEARVSSKKSEKANDLKASEQPQPKEAPAEKMNFIVWFTFALNRFNGIQAHHMTAIRAFFQHHQLGDPETADAYDAGLIKFGLSKKIGRL